MGYIPVRPDFADFEETFIRVTRNHAYSAWVSVNAQMVGSLLGEAGGHHFDKLYMAELLRLYSQTVDVKDDVDPSLFSDQPQCDGYFWERRHEAARCISLDKVCDGLVEDGYAGYKSTVFLNRSVQ